VLVPLHIVSELVTVITGNGVTATLRGPLAVPVPQALIAATVILPDCAEGPAVTVIVLVVAPAVIVHPEGTVHAYPVAPATAVTLNVSPAVPAHGVVLAPVGAAGVAGTFLTVTANAALAALVPQVFDDLTVIFPATAEAEAVTVIVFVVAPPVIVQPVGSVHA
jgi:hypothetical protein